MRALRNEFIIRLYTLQRRSLSICMSTCCRYIAIAETNRAEFSQTLSLSGITSTFRHKRRRIIVTIRLEPRRELLRLS